MSTMQLLPHVMSEYSATLPAEIRSGITPGIRLMGAPAYWAAGIGGQGIVVGVLDTGIDDGHPDLHGQVLGRRDYVNDGVPPAQFHPHGTHVAGTVAATGALRGVAPGVKLRDYRVLDRQGSGSEVSVAQAIRDAVADGCHIISMSLGSPNDNPSVHEAVRYAVAHGVLVVVAVGNDGPGAISFPGYYPEVVGVGAVFQAPDGAIRRAWFSATNEEVDVSAPGVAIVSCAPGGGYRVMSGTSMATPHVSGFAALLLQRAAARLGRMPAEQTLWEALKTGTVDVDALGIDAASGAGFVTAYPTLPRIRTVTVTHESVSMTVDGAGVQLDVPARIVDGRFLVPFRPLLEQGAGAAVSWDESNTTGTARFVIVPGMEV